MMSFRNAGSVNENGFEIGCLPTLAKFPIPVLVEKLEIFSSENSVVTNDSWSLWIRALIQYKDVILPV